MTKTDSRYAYSEGGWSSAEDDFMANDSDFSSPGSPDAQLSSSSGEGLPVPSEITEPLRFSIADLQTLLRLQLEKGGVLPRNWNKRTSGTESLGDGVAVSCLPHPCLFSRLGDSVAQADLLARWIESRSKDCFCLQIPSGLDNPFFVNSVVELLAASQPSIRISTAVIGHSLETWQQDSLEHLLMSLCFQLLSDPDPSWDYPELLGDFEDAFAGCNNAWRESILWVLLRALLTSGENKHRVLALSFPSDPASLQTFSLIIDQLVELANSTERNIQILFFFRHNNGLNLETPYKMSIDLTDGATKENLRADISSWLRIAAHTRKSLRFLEERLLSAVSEHLSQPLFIFSTIQALQYRPWVLKCQVTAEPSLLCNVDSVLKKIPEVDRPLIVDVMSILNYCRRPLTTAELAEALSITQPLPSPTLLSENLTIDLEYDLPRTLPGLVYIANDLVWPLISYVPRSPVQGQSSSSNTTPWLDLGPDAEMRLAFICLKYISTWSVIQESAGNRTKGNPNIKWEFLNYAATFWHYHFLRASRRGSPRSEVAQILKDEPGLIKTCLRLQNSFEAVGVSMTDEEETAIISQFSPTGMVIKFGLQLHDAVAVFNLAAQILPTIKSDVLSAIAFSLWHFKRNYTGSTLLEWEEEAINWDSLVHALNYLPATALNLLSTNPDSIKRNVSLLLATAVRQGHRVLAEKCLQYTTPGVQLLFDILSIHSCLEEGYVSVLRAVPDAMRLILGDEQKNQVTTKFFLRALRYGHLQLVGLLVESDASLAETESLEILFVATDTGQMRTVHQLAKTCTATLRKGNLQASSPLHCASTHNFLSIAKTLITCGASISQKGENGDTPVHMAARFGHLEMVQLLINTNRAELEHSMLTLLNENCEGNLLTEELKSQPLSPNVLEIENSSGSIPIEVAMRSGHESVAVLLIESTPQPTLLSRELLHIATLCGNLHLLKRLLKVQGLDINRKDKRGKTALALACTVGHVSVARQLLEQGAEAWPSDVDKDDLPFAGLHSARDEPAAIEIAQLLTNKSHRPTKSVLNETLLNLALDGNPTLITALIDAGADINVSLAGRTPLHRCAYNNHVDAVRVLLMRGADRSALDSDKDSPLDEATNNCHLEVMRLLLRAGERYPLDGDRCPLVELTERGERDAIEVILECQEEFRGSKVLAKCFHIALRKDNGAIVSMLLDYDADPNAESMKANHGNAIHECAYYGNIKMARVLLDYPGGVKGNNINSQASPYHTPLIAAVGWSYPRSRRWLSKTSQIEDARLTKQRKMIEYLRGRGGDTKIIGGMFGTMLNAAAAQGRPSLFTYVLEEGNFDIKDVDHEGRSAAHFACLGLNGADSVEILELLSKRASGSDMLWVRDNHGRLPLHFACGGQRLEILKYILSDESKKDMFHDSDSDGWTPLHWACRGWNSQCASYLLEKKVADINSLTEGGWRPLDVALFHHNPEFASFLNQNESVVNVTKKGERRFASCDSCLCSIYGAKYTCSKCPNYDLCFKCVGKSSKFHGEVHEFRVSESDNELED